MRVPLLMYHKVAPRPAGSLVPMHYVHPRRFRSHVRALVRFGFTAVTFGQAFDIVHSRAAPVPRPIALTFDDGYENFATEAVPAMLADGARGTVFVVTDLLGAQNAWDTVRGDVAEPLMSSETVRRVFEQGFEVGSHTATHARLTECAPDQLERELVSSREAIETLCGVVAPSFCYPYGAVDDRVAQAVSAAGYRVACTVEKGWNDRSTDAFRWKRVNVRGDTSTPILFWKLWTQARKSATAP